MVGIVPSPGLRHSPTTGNFLKVKGRFCLTGKGHGSIRSPDPGILSGRDGGLPKNPAGHRRGSFAGRQTDQTISDLATTRWSDIYAQRRLIEFHYYAVHIFFIFTIPHHFSQNIGEMHLDRLETGTGVRDGLNWDSCQEACWVRSCLETMLLMETYCGGNRWV